MSEFPIPVTMTVAESTTAIGMTVAESAMTVNMTVATGTTFVPRNYGLITWNGSYITVS